MPPSESVCTFSSYIECQHHAELVQLDRRRCRHTILDRRLSSCCLNLQHMIGMLEFDLDAFLSVCYLPYDDFGHFDSILIGLYTSRGW